MASNSEVGDAKNVANFNLVGTTVKSFNAEYAPTRPELTLASLQALHDEGRGTLDALTVAKNTFRQRATERRVQYIFLKSLATRVFNALLSSDAPDGTIERAQSAMSKIRGTKAPSTTLPPPLPDGTMPDGTSNSQQSADLLPEHFNALIAAVDSEPKYLPSKPDLLVPALKTERDTMLALTAQVGTAIVALNNAVKANFNKIYGDKTGIIAIAEAVETYTLSVYGFKSTEFKAIHKINFTRRKQ